VMSSFSEALPTALCEAMILGKPVVVTTCSGCSSMVGNGAYGIMTNDTPESLLNGLKILMADYAMRKDVSKKSSQRSKQFNIKHAVEKYESVLDQQPVTDMLIHEVF